MKRRRFIPLALFFALCLPVLAQVTVPRIYGKVIEEDTSLPAAQVVVQLLSAKDSSNVDYCQTGQDGEFKITAAPGDYILKFSLMGFVTKYVNIHHTSSQYGLSLGNVTLDEEVMQIDPAIVSVKVEPVVISADTVIYNAAAYRVAPEASLEELLNKIPGLRVDDNDNVTLNGKPITKLLVNGQKFFGGNVKTGLKNLTADMVDNIKTYEMESDFARITGVDDGEQEQVIDLTVKKSLLEGWKGNINLAGGTQQRYNLRGTANKIQEKSQINVVVGQRNNPGKTSINNILNNRLGGGSNGDVTSREAGVNFSKKTEPFDVGGHVQYAGSNRKVLSESSSQSVLSSGNNFSNGVGLNKTDKHNVNGDVNFEWRPNKYWNIIFKPTFTYEYTDALSHSRSKTFNNNPYEIVDNPVEYLDFDIPDDPLKDIRVNATNNKSHNFTERFYTNYYLQCVRRMEKKGRNVTFRTGGAFQRTLTDQFSNNLTRYYRIKKNPDSLLVRNQYVLTGNNVASVNVQLSYNEPLGKGFFAQVTYRPEYKRYTQDKNYYSLVDFPEWSVCEGTRAESRTLLPKGYQQKRSDKFSSAGKYEYFAHNIIANMRYVSKLFNITAGVTVNPKSTWLSYVGEDGKNEVVRKNLVDVAPNITFRYKKNKNEQLAFTYRTVTGSPSMANLLPVSTGSNPLYIRRGNPDLKPSFTHNINFSYNSSNVKKKRSFVGSVTAQIIKNAFSNATVYDAETGARTVSPENISGNWSISGSVSYNHTFKDTRFSLANHTNAGYSNSVAYLYNRTLKADEVNTTKHIDVTERLEGAFRNDWLDFVLSAGGKLNDEKSLLRPQMNQTPFSIYTGASTVITFPLSIRFDTDFTVLFQRGYAFESLNRNYLVWNAGLSKSFFKNKATLRLDWYDILRQQENVTRSFTSERRSISTYNGVNSYLMLRFIYRFKK